MSTETKTETENQNETVDWEKRFKDTQAHATKLAQEIAEIKKTQEAQSKANTETKTEEPKKETTQLVDYESIRKEAVEKYKAEQTKKEIDNFIKTHNDDIVTALGGAAKVPEFNKKYEAGEITLDELKKLAEKGKEVPEGKTGFANQTESNALNMSKEEAEKEYNAFMLKTMRIHGDKKHPEYANTRKQLRQLEAAKGVPASQSIWLK